MTTPLHFLPLGGAGEIGMNLNLYEYDGSWLMCDLGVTFADGELPGIDLIMPDPAFIAERRQNLVGLVLTHAHEDHMGAVPYLWPQLRCPVYATPFAAALLRRKLYEGAQGIAEMEITEIPLGSSLDLDPFRVELVSLTHSIPEPNALVVRTPAGTVMHTGDWKLDADPLISAPADQEALQRLGDNGILAMVCDSTNVFRPGISGSEADVRSSLTELVGGYRRRVAVTTFASNLARLLTVHQAAVANGRVCVPVGRSMRRMIDCARETGYLPADVHFTDDRKAAILPPEQVLYLMTGCQGEANAALSRAADGSHPSVRLEAGDSVIFSSKIIPGNEKPIFDLINRLVRLQVEVVTEKDRFVHVSGHPNRDELARMYELVRPQIALPVHGELRHLREHAALARSLGVPQALEVENGALIRLAPGQAEAVRRVRHGRLAWNGRQAVPVDGRAIGERRQLMAQGTAFASLALDEDGELAADPAIATHGLLDDDDDLVDDLIDDAARAIEALPGDCRHDDSAVRAAVQKALRRTLRATLRRRPVVCVQLLRV